MVASRALTGVSHFTTGSPFSASGIRVRENIVYDCPEHSQKKDNTSTEECLLTDDHTSTMWPNRAESYGWCALLHWNMCGRGWCHRTALVLLVNNPEKIINANLVLKNCSSRGYIIMNVHTSDISYYITTTVIAFVMPRAEVHIFWLRVHDPAFWQFLATTEIYSKKIISRRPTTAGWVFLLYIKTPIRGSILLETTLS